MLKHKTSRSFSGLTTARVEINSTWALPVIARAWLRHCYRKNGVNENTAYLLHILHYFGYSVRVWGCYMRVWI